MKLRYHKSFQKQVIKLKPSQLKRLKVAIVLFQSDPNHPDLYNHPLVGQWQGHRSIAFGVIVTAIRIRWFIPRPNSQKQPYLIHRIYGYGSIGMASF